MSSRVRLYGPSKSDVRGLPTHSSAIKNLEHSTEVAHLDLPRPYWNILLNLRLRDSSNSDKDGLQATLTGDMQAQHDVSG